MMSGFPWTSCLGKACNHGTEVQSECVSFLDSKQVITASDTVQQGIVAPGSYYPLCSATSESEGNEIITVIVPEKFHEYILHGKYSKAISSSDLEYAFMADKESDLEYLDFDQDVQPLILDCGATSTLTSSLFNMSDIREKEVIIQLAGKGATLKATHVGNKTYHVLDCTGTARSVTTRAFYSSELERDLLGGRPLIDSDFRVILDKNPNICGVYPVVDDEISQLNRMEFAPGTGLFCLQSIKISATKFAMMGGYDLWHRRLGHSERETIRKTIPHSKGLEELKNVTFDNNEKCAACMIGKAKLNNLPDLKERATIPLERVYMDAYSSSIPSFEGYHHAIVFIDDASSYRWLYGVRSKDQAYEVVKRWYSDIADIRTKYPLIELCRDNAGENTSDRIKEFIESVGAKNYWSTSYEPWQNGAAEGSVRSIMLLGRTTMAESGCGGKFWFRSSTNGKDARNATYCARIGTTPHMKIYGVPKDVSKFRAFGSECFMYLNKDRRDLGKHTARARRMVYMGFASDDNTSAWKLYDPEKNKFYTSNQVKFNERVFPFRTEAMLNKYAAGGENDIFSYATRANWIDYDKDASYNSYSTVKYYPGNDEVILRCIGKDNTFCRTTQTQYLKDILNKQYATLCDVKESFEEDVNAHAFAAVDYGKAPRSYRDAMSRIDREEWDEAYRAEYQGFIDRDVFEVVRPPPGVKILGTTTVCDYKMDNGVFQKRKVRMCVRGDQQVEGVNFHASDLYSPTVKAAEVRLLAAIAAEHDAPIYKTDTRQAFLYGSMEDEDIYVRPPDWWCDQIPEGHVFKLKKAMYGTKQAARRWHKCLSGWMIDHDYEAVNSEKTIFIKRVGTDFIVDAIFVDDRRK